MSIQLAGCVIVDDAGRLLLLHRQTADYDQWEIPGGKIEPGETPDVTAVRELKEELNLNVRLLRELGQADFEDKGRAFHYSWWLAECDATPEIQESHLFSEYGYKSLDELTGSPVTISTGLARFLELVKSEKITL